ncbi:lipoprotein VacJ-like protein [Legionella birminghamensis]|uniref:Lipoprotein VacJ-like protein n=2 Tax=Legionella birminghamensis TaxID=28083 RepID=A0A378IBZ3_9GAMM|nr:lipoprotein VacJ-like protein [Legionella birminghamensis]STX32543.1 lipoprotein VacJ-like protein [Legionella birminghamensis]
MLASCIHQGPNPVDPYESINRETHKFNMAFDATFLKPPARLYKAVLPGQVRASINNAYENVNMIPTVGNDLLQGEFRQATKDSWRFLINSTLGIAGFFDAASRMGLPPHSNDLGLTFAKWGDKRSPYIVIPFLGPSTIRDGMGMVLEYPLMTPYPYLEPVLTNTLIGVRYVDLRSQLFETEKLMDEALDKYAFIRDAYLQHRNYRITGEQGQAVDSESLYVDENDDESAGDTSLGSDYVDE